MVSSRSRRTWSKQASALILGVALRPVAARTTPQAINFDSSSAVSQARELLQWLNSDKLGNYRDEAVVAFFRTIPAATYCAFLKLSAQRYQEAEFWVRRQERLTQGWTDLPFVNYIKYRNLPRQIYVSWLPGGPDAGQEVLYDETVDPNQVYGHSAGLLGVQSVWLPMNSDLAKAGSNHSMREVGLQYLAEIFIKDTDRCLNAGGDAMATKVEICTESGQRLVAVTWERPAGRPSYYGKKFRLGFDLHKDFVRSIEVWNGAGQIQERIYIDNAQARQLANNEFHPDYPEYRF